MPDILDLQLSPDVRIIRADCREVLPSLGKVDACVTDPPYGIGYYHGGGGGYGSLHGNAERLRKRSFSSAKAMILGDDNPFDPSPWIGYQYVILFGANHYADKLPPSSKWLVWDKVVNPESYGKFSFSDCEMAWTNSKGTARIYHHLWQGCRRAGESNKFGKLHPNRKPVELITWAMRQVDVPVCAIVLDPFMGSATTGIACIRTGRKFIGIEKDENCFEIARERLENELRQERMPLEVANG